MTPAREEWLADLVKTNAQLAAILEEYRKELVMGGFTREEALALIVARQEQIMQPAFRPVPS